jgi:hypothetical protein
MKFASHNAHKQQERSMQQSKVSRPKMKRVLTALFVDDVGFDEAIIRANAEAVRRNKEEAAARKMSAKELARHHFSQISDPSHEAVAKWCKLHGFRDLHTPKKTLRGATKYPLHSAVKHNLPGLIRLMLMVRVRTDVVDSKHQTPHELAAKLNSNGSHDKILTMLSEMSVVRPTQEALDASAKTHGSSDSRKTIATSSELSSSTSSSISHKMSL